MILSLYDVLHFQSLFSVAHDDSCDLAHLTKMDAINTIMYAQMFISYGVFLFMATAWSMLYCSFSVYCWKLSDPMMFKPFG
jgi:hypothetical protein